MKKKYIERIRPNSMQIINWIRKPDKMYSDFEIQCMLEIQTISPETAFIYALTTRLNPETGYLYESLENIHQRIPMLMPKTLLELECNFVNRGIIHFCNKFNKFRLDESSKCEYCEDDLMDAIVNNRIQKYLSRQSGKNRVINECQFQVEKSPRIEVLCFPFFKD